MSKPFFSLIIPVYNVAPYLRECLESVRAQTFEDWEAICVDDGSTDSSGLIIDEFVDRDRRFRKITKRNGGLASARNAAIPNASGLWIGFLDSDDKIECRWLEVAKRRIDQDAPDMLRMNFKFWDPCRTTGNQVWNSSAKGDANYQGREEVLRWGWEELINGGWVWLYFLRKEIFLGSGVLFPENAIVKEDVIFDMNLLPHLNSVSQVDYDGYRYRMRGDSLWHKPRALEACLRFLDDVYFIWKKQRSQIEEMGLSSLARRQMSVLLWCDLREWISFGERSERRFDSSLLQRYLRFSSECGIAPWAQETRWRIGIWYLIHLKSLSCLYFIDWLWVFARKIIRR